MLEYRKACGCTFDSYSALKQTIRPQEWLCHSRLRMVQSLRITYRSEAEYSILAKGKDVYKRQPLGRHIDEASPLVDARLKDGSRVNIIIPPLALNGPCITIRKFSQTPLSVENLISFGTLSEEMAIFLRACIKARLNIMVSGGTGSGKTTTLNLSLIHI